MFLFSEFITFVFRRSDNMVAVDKVFLRIMLMTWKQVTQSCTAKSYQLELEKEQLENLPRGCSACPKIFDLQYFQFLLILNFVYFEPSLTIHQFQCEQMYDSQKNLDTLQSDLSSIAQF